MHNQAGKGDSPRNCLSQQFRDNYNKINWHHAQCPKCDSFEVFDCHKAPTFGLPESYFKECGDCGYYWDFA
jgi:hypothetical protein